MIDKAIKRFAFIDAQNTESTASQVLGFIVDWKRMFAYLKEQWGCEKIFLYSGIQQGNEASALEYQTLSELGYIVRAKPYFIYKNKDSILKLNCPRCNTEINHKIDRGVKWKSNCDVELTVDAENNAQTGVEYLIFTGDGDFEYLMRDVIEKGVRTYIISSARKIRMGPRYFVSRFSTKLRNLIDEKRGKVDFFELNDWKMRIKKDS